jgi:putative oxidoreductase
MNKLSTLAPIFQDFGLTSVRVITGLFMVYHGWEVFDATKMNEYAQWDMFKNSSGTFMVYLGKGAELVGGLMLTLGLFTRIGAIILFGTMAYIAFFIGHGKVWYEDQHPFMFVLLAIVFFVMGGGNWSLDKTLSKN